MTSDMPGTHGSQTVSKRGFAELLGLTPGRVSHFVKAGLPVEPNGRINVEKGRAWYRDNVDQNRRRGDPDGEPPARSSKAKKDAADAEIAQMRAARLAGDLIDRATVLRAVEGRGRFEREAWIGWVNRAAPEIASASGADLAAVVVVLDRLVRDQLATLAATPLPIGAEVPV